MISVCQESISKNFEWKKVIWQLPFLQIIKHFLFWLEFKQIIGRYYDQKKRLCLVSSLKNTDLNHYRFWTSNDVIRQINHLDISVFDKRKKALLVDIWQKNDDAKHLANEVNPFMHLKIGLARLHQQEKQNLSKFHFENQIFRLLQAFRFAIEMIFGISIMIPGMFLYLEKIVKLQLKHSMNKYNGTFSVFGEIIELYSKNPGISFGSPSQEEYLSAWVLTYIMKIIDLLIFVADTYAYMPYIWKNTTTLTSQPWGNRFITTPLMFAVATPKIFNVGLFIGLFMGRGFSWICFGIILLMVIIYLAMFFMVTKFYYKNFENLPTKTNVESHPDSESGMILIDLGEKNMDAGILNKYLYHFYCQINNWIDEFCSKVHDLTKCSFYLRWKVRKEHQPGKLLL